MFILLQLNLKKVVVPSLRKLARHCNQGKNIRNCQNKTIGLQTAKATLQPDQQIKAQCQFYATERGPLNNQSLL